jgi:hypothetical protein
MSIAVQIHDKDPRALADVIEKTMHEGVVVDSEPEVGTLAVLVANEEREGDKRRAAWHWLNSISGTTLDRDNDWSDI